MSRPTKVIIDAQALVHNIAQIKRYAPDKKIIAMVKANAYGCGLAEVIPNIDGKVDAFGVASLSEAIAIRALGAKTSCLLFQGVFSSDELRTVSENQFGCVIHQKQQLAWLLATPLSKPISLWIKVNTGMNRLGFQPNELDDIVDALDVCPWVDKNIGLMTHFACADEPERLENKQQIAVFNTIDLRRFDRLSMVNSAGIIAFPEAHMDTVRAGIMLYGVSPFPNKTAYDLGLIPVMRFISQVTAVHKITAGSQVGYGATWTSSKPSIIGVVPAGYGDGYPRHMNANAPIWVDGNETSLIGRVSMDIMTIDLTDYPDVEVGAPVELWGTHVLVERVAKASGTIGYELLCQITDRARLDNAF